MSRSEKKIVRKTINWCKSVKKNIGQFSYEYDDEENFADSDDVDYHLESDFKEVITNQHERLEDLYIELNDFLEDYDGDNEYEISQANMNIDSAAVQLQDILANICSWEDSSDYNNQITDAIEYLDEAIEYLEGCLSEDI